MYEQSIQGRGVVRAFERYLETGDASKISKGLYHLATMRCGYIAHFNIHGFRGVYADPTEFLRGEFYSWRRREHDDEAPILHAIEHLDRYLYTDGMTDLDVIRECCEIAERLGDDVAERSRNGKREAELALARALAEKHGLAVS